ncbi:MAG: hypothetical protein RL365_572 [Bacteroidota bacterium]|jgi:hypothetical protein
MIKTLLPALAFVVGTTAFAQTHFSDDFNDGNLTGWTSTDNDNDAPVAGANNYDIWYAANMSGAFAQFGAGSAVSRSWANNIVYSPNNFLVSPAINLTAAPGVGLSLMWEVGSIESTASTWYEEHYAVYVSTSNTPATMIASAPVFEETLSAGETVFVRTVDLSAYAGQTIYVMFRHYNCTDENALVLDNVLVKNLQPNDASVEDVVLNRYSQINSNNTLAVTVKNAGFNPINSLEINWNDGVDHIQTINGLNIAPGTTVNVNHPTAVNYATAVEENITVTISQVNSGVDSDPTNNNGNAKINTVSVLEEKSVVIEEGTGTWCQWCPRGAVAMDYMVNTYPNDFIGIAVHNGDPMTVAEYDDAANFSGYPSSNVDRALLGQSVSQNAFISHYNARKDLIVPAGMSVAASGSGNSVSIVATATFRTPVAAANYRLGVIVTEDGVTGTTSGYNQANAYAGGGNGAMGGYESLPNPVPAAQMVYNHVGRYLLGGYNGQVNSVPAVITDGQVVNYTFNYTIPATSTRANMHAVAVLIDQSNGEIVNAIQGSLSGASLSEVETIGMEVYPNPANDVVNVKFLGNGGDYQISITDLAGRQVASSFLVNANGAQSVTLPIAEFSAGNYLVTISKDGASYTQNLIIK